jgi:hypothetical protein
MPRRIDVEDDWEDDEEDEEDSYFSEDDDDDTVPCPHCRRQIYEQAEQCPYCGKYISIEDAPLSRKPWWFVAGFLLCALIVGAWIWRGL